MDKKQNYMTVPAALRELEKIEMVRQLDKKYTGTVPMYKIVLFWKR